MGNLRETKVDLLADDPIDALRERDNRIKAAMRGADPKKGLEEPQKGLRAIFGGMGKSKDKTKKSSR